MRKALISIVVLSVAVQLASAERKTAPKTPPRVEVVFVLDTTGSMGGLIAGAKAKIWSIANQIVLGKPKPVVHMGLVGYRDKGDAYVTKTFALTDNIDQIYTDLMKFRASGGGDGPENVNQALYDAVHKLKWSKDRKTLKIIYLVGDFPPHNEYKDVPTYDKTAKAAIEKGIYINTILCGRNAQARKVWQEIARAAEGTFLAIAQSGGVTEVPTPYDTELGKLNAELTRTVVVYGDQATQERNAKLNAGAAEYSSSIQAKRAVFAGSSGISATGDLLDAVRDKRVDLSKLKDDELPKNMRKMTPGERTKYIASQQAKRNEIIKKIKDLSAKRATHIKKELSKTKGSKAGFDHKVVETLKRQAARKDIRYEK
ncbi:MAG: vWA domain-containing protein [Phycisphaerae bacterium]|jgi:hypothetical protein|nr:vWA domain-containing protein [Phycisphaerae bacterium]